MVRRLPIIQFSSPEEEAAASRPRWHWAFIGGALIFSVWIPLAIISEWVVTVLSGPLVNIQDPEAVARFTERASPGHRVALAASVLGPVVLAYVLACLAGGALVGRYGVRARALDAALGGVLAATTAWLVATVGGALQPWSLSVATLIVLTASGGLLAGVAGRFGYRKRPGIRRLLARARVESGPEVDRPPVGH